ncbi:MAG: helix-turn-helix domain-containing protein [Clostridium sp.]|nr:helix-turn-helix domain-containing protein [Clostridium sp.]
MEKNEKKLGVDIAGIKVYTIPEVSKALGVTPQTVRNYIKIGRLQARRVGRSLLITEKDIKKFINTPQ